MKLWLNDQETQLVAPQSLAQALVAWEYTTGTFAVALNNTFVPKSEYEHTHLKDNDKIDVVTPMQGG